MATSGRQKERLEIWIFNGKDKFSKKSSAKMIGGLLDFKEADPTEPVIWLGDKSYTVYNAKSKKTILCYDTLSKSLFRPADMGNQSAEADMFTQAGKNVIVGGRWAAETLGIQDATGTAYKFALAMIVVLAIVAVVGLYVIVNQVGQHTSSGGTSSSGSSILSTNQTIGIGPVSVSSSPSSK